MTQKIIRELYQNSTCMEINTVIYFVIRENETVSEYLFLQKLHAYKNI